MAKRKFLKKGITEVGTKVKRIGKNDEVLTIIDSGKIDGVEKLLLRTNGGFCRWYSKSSITSSFIKV